MIKVGDKIPACEFSVMGAEGPQKLSTAEVFKGKTVVLFGVPGAFTPTCSMNHLPGFVKAVAEIKSKGVDEVACISVNDAFVMQAWGKASDVKGDILMLADGSAEFAKAMGLDVDLSNFGMGLRNKRFSLIAKDGVVKSLHVEEKSGVTVSGAETILSEL